MAATAAVIGDVELGAHSSVWFGAVVRGDVNYIRIGQASGFGPEPFLSAEARKRVKDAVWNLDLLDSVSGLMSLVVEGR